MSLYLIAILLDVLVVPFNVMATAYWALFLVIVLFKILFELFPVALPSLAKAIKPDKLEVVDELELSPFMIQ